MIKLTDSALTRLRNKLQNRGERPSRIIPIVSASTDLLEAMHAVEEYGAMVEAMYLVMVSDRKVSNVERDVLRGALRILSDDHVRSTHMESMLDAAAKRIAESGAAARLEAVVEQLKGDRSRAAITILLACAVAAADDVIMPEEQAVVDALAEGLGVSEADANELLEEVNEYTSPRLAIPKPKG